MKLLKAMATILLLEGLLSGQTVDIPVELAGQIRSAPGGQTTSGARVTLARAGIPIADQFAGRDGTFLFERLQAGVYTLEVHADGATVSERISILAGREEVVVTLPPRTKAPKAPGAISADELRVPAQARKEIEEGRKLRLDDKCPNAIGRLQKALSLFEPAASAHYELGLCYRELGKPEAERELARAFALSGGEEEALQLADLLYRTGRLEESSAVLHDALRKHSESGDLRGALAHVYYKQGNIPEAVRSAVIAEGREHHLANVHLLLAKIYEHEAPEKMIPEAELYIQEESPASPTRKQILERLAASRAQSSTAERDSR